ncbi:MAG: chemotaxis protein [Thiotrichales bacterium]|nr:MAG: chemotaxis protein [Thiotrichales bacterium]
MADFIIAIVGILLLLSGWLFVQHLARWYAARHPEFGPAREEGGGCGHCLCGANSCDKRAKHETAASDDNEL